MDQEQSADKHCVGLTLLEVLLQRRAELFRIFHKLLLALLDGLLSGCAGDEADDFVYSVEQLLNGTCDFSARFNIEYNSISSVNENQLTLLSPGRSCDRWSRRGCGSKCAWVRPTSCWALGMRLQFCSSGILSLQIFQFHYLQPWLIRPCKTKDEAKRNKKVVKREWKTSQMRRLRYRCSPK